MRKLVIGAGAVLLVALAATIVFGHPSFYGRSGNCRDYGYGSQRGPGMRYEARHGREYGMRGPEKCRDHKPYAGMTEEQRAEAGKIREKYLKDTEQLRKEIREKRNELHLLWNNKAPDREEILKSEKAFRELQGRLAEKRTDHLLELRKSFPSGSSYGHHMGRRGQVPSFNGRFCFDDCRDPGKPMAN